MRRVLIVLFGMLAAVGVGIGAAVVLDQSSSAFADGGQTLLGDTNVEAISDGGYQTSEAFGYVAAQSGTSTDVMVYLTSTSGVRVGVYSSSNGRPATRLATGSIASNTSGWVDVPIAGVNVTAGRRYWLVIAARTGTTIAYRDVGSSGSGYDYSGNGLQNPYAISHQWNSNPASVYLVGSTTTTTTTTTSSSTTSTTPTTTTTSTTPTTTTTTSSSSTTTPSGTYSLPADRTYDWNPGLNAVGGIPSGSWAVYKTISPSGGDDTATIQAALDSCPKNGIVQLAAGVFHISGQGLAVENSYCVLRGTGPGPGNWPAGTAASGTGGTYLEKSSGTNYPVAIMGPRWTEGPGSVTANLTADAVKGSKSVTVASTSGLSVGQLVVVDELTDTSISHIHSNDTYDLSGYMEGGNRPLGDTMEIASISGDTVTFTTDFPTTYKVSQSAHLYPVSGGQVNYSGIEDLYLYDGEGGDGGGGLHLFNCDHCWVKHIEDTWSDGAAIHVDQSFGVEIRDSFFHDCKNDNLWSGGSCYGIGLNWYTSNTLVENNIIHTFNAADVMRNAGGGNVMGYNYTDDIADNGGQWENNGIMASHMTTPHYELFEGNQAPNFGADDRWGNSAYITVFRNHFPGYNSGFQAYGPQRGVSTTQWHWWQTFVGNVLGTSDETWTTAYEGIDPSSWWGYEWLLCYQSADTVPDGGKCVSTTLRDGNFDYFTKQVHWHGIGGTGVNNGLTPPADATLPDSLYLSGKPAFFGSSAWPWVDGSSASNPLPGTLPARTRFDAGTPNAVG